MEEQEMSKEECDDLIRKGELLRRRTGLGLYLIRHHDEAIGYCGFMETHPLSNDIDVIYAFIKAHTGNGFGTETCKALVELYQKSDFEGSLTAVVHPMNLASIKVLEKSHFQNEGFADGDLNHLLKYKLVT